MGERKDLLHGMKQVKDLEERWQGRRMDLEQKLDESWARLKAREYEDNNAAERDTTDIYRQIARLDRSISFLDRALIHLDDIEHGGQMAQDIPLSPASSPRDRKQIHRAHPAPHHGPQKAHER